MTDDALGQAIEYLIARRYTKYPRLTAALSRRPSSDASEPPGRPDHDATLEKIDRYRLELQAMDKNLVLIAAAKGRLEDQANEKREAEHKQAQQFVNIFDLPVDYGHWSRMPHWTLEEALALSFGKDPEFVTWDAVQCNFPGSMFMAQYRRVREIAHRAVQWQQLFDPVLPQVFLAWAKRTEIDIPPSLVEAVEARGIQVADWKTLYDQEARRSAELSTAYDAMVVHRDKAFEVLEQLTEKHKILVESSIEADAASKARIKELEAALATATSAAKEKPIGSRERESLLKLIIGMAIGGYAYDPKMGRSSQTGEIAHDLQLAGVDLDQDTVRKWLREAAQLLPRQTE